jgi:hypothetical protein
MTCDLQTLDRDATVVRGEAANPFIVDIIAPTGIDKPIYRTLDEKISKVKGIQDTSVINGD